MSRQPGTGTPSISRWNYFMPRRIHVYTRTCLGFIRIFLWLVIEEIESPLWWVEKPDLCFSACIELPSVDIYPAQSSGLRGPERTQIWPQPPTLNNQLHVRYPLIHGSLQQVKVAHARLLHNTQNPWELPTTCISVFW